MKRILCLAAAALVLFAGAGWAQTTYIIRAGTESGRVSVTWQGVAVATNVYMYDALDKIRETSLGEPIVIQFGGGDSVFNISDAIGGIYIRQERDDNPKWGAITLTGSIMSENKQLELINYDSVDSLNVTSRIKISVEDAYGSALYVYGNVNLTVDGGKISLTGKENMNISAVHISSGCKVKITGGEFESKGGAKVLTVDAGAFVSISDTSAKLTVEPGDNPAVEITGGALEIGGGAISNGKEGGIAVKITGYSSSLTFAGGAKPPKITGSVAANSAGAIRVDASFKPGSADKYTLDLTGGARADGAVAVTGGGAVLSNFVFTNDYYQLEKKDADIVVKLKAGVVQPKFVITGDPAAGFTVKENTTEIGKNLTIGAAFDSMRIRANGRPCGIQFGSGGADVLDAGGKITFQDAWGRVSLSGKVKGPTDYDRGGPIPLIEASESVAIDNEADILPIDGKGGNLIVCKSNVNFTHIKGEIGGEIYISNANGVTLTVAGGKVKTIGNYYGNKNTIKVSGGTVGDSTLVGPAIKSEAMPDAEIIVSGGTVVSADTGAENSGTIVIRGENHRLKITGGAISNVASTDNIVSAVYANTAKGSVEITGGKISRINKTADDTKNGYAVFIDQSAPDSVYVKMLSVSGTAEITTNARNAIRIKGNGVTAADKTKGGADVEISGGKIANTGEDTYAAAVYAQSFARVYISGTAELSANSKNAKTLPANSAQPVYRTGVVNGYSSSHVYILGGKITSVVSDTALYVPVAVSYHSYSANSGGEATINLGGSPDIEGVITASYTERAPTVITSGASAFKPGSKVYKISATQALTEKKVAVRNGVGFASNFAIATTYTSFVANDAEFRLAANGDDIVATKGRTREVKFNIMGAAGTAPAPITVVDGGTLGEAAKPATESYVSADKHKNDGKWHIAGVQSANGEWTYSGNEFKFGAGNNGTDVNNDMTLLLKWTDEIVSVLAGSREIPAASGPSVAAIAPAAVTAGELTAGPNPSAKQSGKVSFFWNGAPLKSGKLTIFDAAGKAVAKITLSGDAAGKRQVADWNLKDAKGRLVSDGTYVAKGVVNTKSGKTEKVSILLGVR